MKKIYINCIYRNNFGDDLLLKVLCDRYQNNAKFLIINYEAKYKSKLSSNITVVKVPYFFYRFFRKISKMFFKKRNIIDSFFIRRCDMIFVVGGSLFMETESWNEKNDYNRIWYHKLSKPYFVIGANIGPIYTREYIKFLRKNIFKNAEGIFLRDSKSYRYVKSLSNVLQIRDLAFSFDVRKYKKVKSQRKVFISVIDIEAKKNQMINPNADVYNKLIKKLMTLFLTDHYQIVLASLCSQEGDMKAIQSILKFFDNREQIQVVDYRGNLDLMMMEFASSEIIVGTRFHANVIGFLLHKVVIPIAYNDKTINLLKDINFKGTVFDANYLKDVDAILKKDLDLSYCYSFQQNFQKEKNKCFEILDSYIKGDE